MARRRRYKPIARIRRALLLLLILSVGAATGYYVLKNLDAQGDSGEAADAIEDAPLDVSETLLTVARGFDYEVTDGQELAFRVKAEKLVADVEDRMELDQVAIELPQEDGGVVTVTGETGTIHLDSKSATLEGNVRARTQDGIELRGAGFEVVREGRTLISTAPVKFAKRGEFQGAARNLQYAIKKERLVLEGNVVIKSLPLDDLQATTLRCQKLTYDRLEKTLRLEGKVRIDRGLEFLEAGRLSLTFGESESDLKFVRAESNVRGRYVPVPAAGELASRVDVRGRLLYAVFEAGQAVQAELRGPQDRSARLTRADVSGLSTILTSPEMTVDFLNGEISLAEAAGPVEVEERMTLAGSSPLRRVCSDKAIVRFDDLGELDTLMLNGSVDYRASGVHASGTRVTARGANDSVDIRGAPAVVVTERGDLESPRIIYLAEGRVNATGGVRAEMRRESNYSLMGGESSEPLRITADQARWEEEPEKVTFIGSVRAWQGADYLLTDRLVGEPELDLLTATGSVKSVIRPNSDEELLGQEESEEQVPIEVTAKKLIFEQPLGVITYEGGARAVQGERTLECDEMDVELDDENDFDRMVCTGNLVVEDPAQGKKVQGEVAVYVPADDEVDVTGDPVVLTDSDGTALRGGRILYNFETGGARISSRPEARADAEEDGADTTEPPELEDSNEGDAEG